MSYDVWIEADLGAGPLNIGLLDSNMTWNIAPMVAEAVGSTPSSWDGMPASAVLEMARTVARSIEDEPDKYKAMNPANGWGSAEGCLKWMREIAAACEQAPLAVFRVC